MTTYMLKRGTSILQSVLFLSTEQRLIAEEAVKLRGFMGHLFIENDLIHNHKSDGLRYGYPKIQFQVKDGQAVIVGLADGAEIVSSLQDKIDFLRINEKLVEVKEHHLCEREVTFGNTSYGFHYSFLTPWLALNEENYEKYKSSSLKDRHNLLRRILIGNILSMSKGLGYVVTEEIKISRLDVYPVKSSVCLKGVEMTGFKGTFSVNFDLPDYIGLGKSVSRGFGTVFKRKG